MLLERLALPLPITSAMCDGCLVILGGATGQRARAQGGYASGPHPREDAGENMQRGRGSRQVQRVSSRYERECQSCRRTAHRGVGPRPVLQGSPACYRHHLARCHEQRRTTHPQAGDVDGIVLDHARRDKEALSWPAGGAMKQLTSCGSLPKHAHEKCLPPCLTLLLGKGGGPGCQASLVQWRSQRLWTSLGGHVVRNRLLPLSCSRMIRGRLRV